VRDRPIRYALGGHIEMDAQGKLFAWESQYHPNEHVLQMTKDDLLALPAAVGRFNGFYTASGGFVLMNSMRILVALAVAVGVVMITLLAAVVLYVKRRRARRRELR
jgi:hydroxyacylglutathione hydrolase